MSTNVKKFFQRGLMFSGFGPIVAGIVYAIIEYTVPNFSLSGTQVCLAIITTYILAFVHAGASVFNQIEEWPIAKSMLCHFLTLYVAYTVCYILNTWIPFNLTVLLIYTAIFAATYFLIWMIVFIAIKITSNKMNRSLEK
ncbi:MAG: DUF3021 domain-containing protein [Clostridia bacterium]|nr:DUF3021 domain-containing protein [Clostridia bacterium]